jgi:formylaminopyrimidine deformylase / aminopyrimidine aminohydrolase
MSFTAEQSERVADLWLRMLSHPFLVQTRDGTIGDDTFARWMRQDYLFVAQGVHFLAALLARAPERHRDSLADAVDALRKELVLFEEQAGGLGVELADTRPAFITHAYEQFLMATALGASYAEAYTVLYVAERAYHDSWCVVREGIAADSKWLPFVDNWAGDAFSQYVHSLEGELDALAAEAGPAERGRMAALFELTTRYEIAFWEMALVGDGWPGLPEGA